MEKVEAEGVGPSGVLTKLWRVEMGIKWLQLESEDVDIEFDVLERGNSVRNMIGTICTTLNREKSALQTRKMESFSRDIPDLGEVMKFLTCPEVDSFYQQTLDEARQGVASKEHLYQAMIIIAGRLMLR